MIKKNILLYIIAIIFSINASYALSVELVKTNPSPIVAGDYADLTIRFTNEIGNSADKTEVSFMIEDGTYFKQISSESNSISKFFSGESVTRTFRVFFSDKINQGYIDVPIIVKYNGQENRYKLKVYVEDSLVEPHIEIGQIKSIPNEILIDSKNNKLSITLQNLGDKKAELIKAVLISESENIEGAYSFSMQDSISSISGGEEGVVEFTIDIEDQVIESAPMVLNLRYRAKNQVSNTYEIFNKNLSFDLPIASAPFLVVEKVEQIDNFQLGSTENRLKITIRNDGVVDAKNVRVRIVPDISYPFIFEETTQYVSASIKKGENASVMFKAEVSKDGQVREYTSKVILESLVEDTRYSQEDTIKITANDGDKIEIKTIGFLIIGLIIIVSIGLGINTYNSNKKNQKLKKNK